ncbi:DUF418 domain-containing protein [Kocuria nitroreducens]|uniref:DUF418 domain-containing protein n=1 Tax=Kocuria nitroreducens TaxID=3058914 RepID=UPI0036DA0F4D
MNAPHSPRATVRVPAPDVARGLMLWVIAVANVTVWIWAAGPTDGPRDRTLGTGADTAGWTADDVVNMAMSMLVDGRGFPLFSFLVGYGAGQIAAREAARRTPLPLAQQLLLRRYGWLLLVGALHACLLFPGDIITAYAFGGLFLALLITASTRVLVVLTGLGAALMVLYGAAGWAARNPGTVRFPSLVAESPQESLTLGVAEGIAVVTLAPIQLLGLLPMMLLGLALSRYRVLEDPGPRRGRLLGTAVVCIALGLATGTGTGLLTTDRLEPSPTGGSVITGMDAVTGAAQGIGYALVVALVCDRVLRRTPGPRTEAGTLRAREHPALWSLQALGRRSMSGYLAQSVLFTVLLPPFALGLGRSLTPTAALLLGSAVWLATLLGAAMLERRGLPGPAEALHRRLYLGPARDRSGPPPPASA